MYNKVQKLWNLNKQNGGFYLMQYYNIFQMNICLFHLYCMGYFHRWAFWTILLRKEMKICFFPPLKFPLNESQSGSCWTLSLNS